VNGCFGSEVADGEGLESAAKSGRSIPDGLHVRSAYIGARAGSAAGALRCVRVRRGDRRIMPAYGFD
jgi:hypothetical protein